MSTSTNTSGTTLDNLVIPAGNTDLALSEVDIYKGSLEVSGRLSLESVSKPELRTTSFYSATLATLATHQSQCE